MDRRKRKTQQSLAKALYTALGKQSFEQITVSQLCETADINRGTFYLNYLDKYDLLEQLIKEQIQQLITYCQVNEEHLDHLTATLEFLLDQKKLVLPLLQADGQGVFTMLLTDHLLQSEVDIPEVQAIFVANGLVGVIKHLLTSEGATQQTLQEFADFLAQHQNFTKGAK